MWKRFYPTAVVPVFFSAILSGCFTPPKPLAGTFTRIGVSEAQHGAGTGNPVRWGGTIISTTPAEEDTCLEILARPLNAEARPRRTDESDGRFIACARGFYDPAIYARGRDVTVVGTLQKPEERTIGQHKYVFPKVAAETVYLWPKRPEVYLYQPWYDPYWYPGWGPWYYAPFWGPWPYGPW